MAANIKYKDSVFSLLFGEPALLRELYGALVGVDLPKDIPVTINTLHDVLFKGRINDISFEMDGKLIVLLEHQSTVNPNLPLRILMYIARLYEKIVGDRNIYASKLIRLPRAVFFVLYNGKEELPDRLELRLSDMFEDAESLGIPIDEVMLEVTVRVVNINFGRNRDISERCETLAGYSAFVAKAREFEAAGLDKEEALKRAIRHCREHDILQEFMEKHSTEVFNMLLAEWNWDDALTVSREEGREEGRNEGRSEGLIDTARNALAEGASIEFVNKITGLHLDTIAKLRPSPREPLI